MLSLVEYKEYEHNDDNDPYRRKYLQELDVHVAAFFLLDVVEKVLPCDVSLVHAVDFEFDDGVTKDASVQFDVLLRWHLAILLVVKLPFIEVSDLPFDQSLSDNAFSIALSDTIFALLQSLHIKLDRKVAVKDKCILLEKSPHVLVEKLYLRDNSANLGKQLARTLALKVLKVQVHREARQMAGLLKDLNFLLFETRHSHHDWHY